MGFILASAVCLHVISRLQGFPLGPGFHQTKHMCCRLYESRVFVIVWFSPALCLKISGIDPRLPVTLCRIRAAAHGWRDGYYIDKSTRAFWWTLDSSRSDDGMNLFIV